MVLFIFGFWELTTILGFKKVIKEKQNLNSQKKIVGDVKILEKEIKIVKGSDDDIFYYLLKIYSDFEDKQKQISIDKRDYDVIEIETFIWIEYFFDSNYIKSLVYRERNINNKNFHI